MDFKERLFSLGVLYYNEGRREESTEFEPMTTKQFHEIVLNTSNKFSLSKTFFEKAFTVNPDVPELIEILSELRSREFATIKFIEKWIDH